MLRACQLRDTNNIVRSHPTVVIALLGSSVSEQLYSSREELTVVGTSALKCWPCCTNDFIRSLVSGEILSSSREELRQIYTPYVGWLRKNSRTLHGYLHRCFRRITQVRPFWAILNDRWSCTIAAGVIITTYWSPDSNYTGLEAYGGENCREKPFVGRQKKISCSTSINFITVVSRLSHSRDAFRVSPGTNHIRAKRSMSNYLRIKLPSLPQYIGSASTLISKLVQTHGELYEVTVRAGFSLRCFPSSKGTHFSWSIPYRIAKSTSKTAVLLTLMQVFLGRTKKAMLICIFVSKCSYKQWYFIGLFRQRILTFVGWSHLSNY